MRAGGYTAHLAALRTTRVTRRPADHRRIFASSSDVLLGHREKITAGVPGCTCGEAYPEDSYPYFPVLHAQHVAEVIVFHVLDAAVAAVHADVEDFARNPARWKSGGHDSMAAIDAINEMARAEAGEVRPKEKATA